MEHRALLIGIVLGFVGFYIANREEHGPYTIGVTRTEEIIGIIVFLMAAFSSKEPISAALLMMIAAWHTTCSVYYWDKTTWF